jgi:hypothetical protein
VVIVERVCGGMDASVCVIFVLLKSIIYLIRDHDSHELLAGVIGLRLFLLQAGFLLK